eukprot:14110480-Ditylum_brightwellii.AAC.1
MEVETVDITNDPGSGDENKKQSSGREGSMSTHTMITKKKKRTKWFRKSRSKQNDGSGHQDTNVPHMFPIMFACPNQMMPSFHPSKV